MIGSEDEPVSITVGVVGVVEGPEAPISLMGSVVGEAPIAPVSLAGEVFGGAPIAPVSLAGRFLGGAPIAPVSLWYIFMEPKASEEVGWKGEALGLRLLFLSVEEVDLSVVGIVGVEVG